MKFWREASTLILALRPRLTTTFAQGQSFAAATVVKTSCEKKPLVAESSHTHSAGAAANDYKILMLKRSAQSSFMPSRLVFPGGMIQDVDFSKDWTDIFKQVTGCSLRDVMSDLGRSSSELPMMSEQRTWPISADVAFRICAIRETFEESGLLIVTKQSGQMGDPTPVSCVANSLTLASDMWRKKVHQDPANFLHLCHELGVVPNVWALHTWRNWLTPAFQKVDGPPKKPRRFDTIFYACCIDCDRIPQTFADESETTEAEWRGPDEYIQLANDKIHGHPVLAPPQRYELMQLSTVSDLDALLKVVHGRSVSGIRRFMPVYRVCQDAVLLLLPGDYLYPEKPDYEGQLDILPPYPCTLSELDDKNQSHHRITFTDKDTLEKVKTRGNATLDGILHSGTATFDIK